MLHILLIICCIIIATSHILKPMDKNSSAQKHSLEVFKEDFSKNKYSNDKSKLPKHSSNVVSQKPHNLLALHTISKSDPTLHKSKQPLNNDATSPGIPSSQSANKFLQKTTSPIKLPRALDTKKQSFSLIEAFKAKHPNNKVIQETLKLYINDPTKNINEQDEFKNTPLHYAILKRDTLQIVMDSYYDQIIYPLLSHPFLDTTIKNDQGITAPQLIIGGDLENPTLRRTLFARTILDIEVHQETFNMLMNLSISDQIVENIIKTVETRIHGLEGKQGDSNLPKDTLFPQYATKEFITQMIKSRTNKEQANINELYSANGSLTYFNPNPIDDTFTTTKDDKCSYP